MRLDFILPVFNTDKSKLERCINSILNQTNPNWNLTIIDDGSEIDLAKHLDVCSDADSRITVFHVPNGGVSSARNIGIQNSSNDYFCFCDSDDKYEDDFVNRILQLISYNADLIIGGVTVFNHNNTIEKRGCSSLCEFSSDDAIHAMIDYLLATYNFNKNYYFGSLLLGRLYSKVYKRSVFNNLRFDDDLWLHEDNLYSLQVLSQTKSVLITDDFFYCYYLNDGSLSHKQSSAREIHQEILFFEKLMNHIDPENYDSFVVRASLIISSILNLSSDLRLPLNELFEITNRLIYNQHFDLLFHQAHFLNDISRIRGLGNLTTFVYMVLRLKNKVAILSVLGFLYTSLVLRKESKQFHLFIKKLVSND